MNIDDFENLKLHLEPKTVITVELKNQSECTVIGVYTSVTACVQALKLCSFTGDEVFQVQVMMLDEHPESSNISCYSIISGKHYAFTSWQ